MTLKKKPVAQEEDLLDKHLVDVVKLSFEAMKHLTTLNTGALLLMITFLDRLFGTNQEWKFLVGVSLVCFMISTVTAMSTLLQTVNVVSYVLAVDERALRRQRLKVVTEALASTSFLFGLVSLCIFAFKNLY